MLVLRAELITLRRSSVLDTFRIVSDLIMSVYPTAWLGAGCCGMARAAVAWRGLLRHDHVCLPNNDSSHTKDDHNNNNELKSTCLMRSQNNVPVSRSRALLLSQKRAGTGS